MNLSDLTEEEKLKLNELLSRSTIQSRGDMGYLNGEGNLPLSRLMDGPRPLTSDQSYGLQQDNSEPGVRFNQQPAPAARPKMPQNYVQVGNNPPTDLGPSVRQPDVYRDGPQVLDSRQLPDGRTIQKVRVAATDGFGRQSSEIMDRIVTPDYLNPAALAQQKFEAAKAQIAHTKAQTEGANAKPVAVYGADGKTPEFVLPKDAIGRKPYTALGDSLRGTLTPEQNDALFGPNGAVTTGKLDMGKVNSRTAPIYANAALKAPDTDFAKISSDIALGRNAGFRQKAMTAEIMPEILNNVVAAGKKVDFSDNRTMGNMQKWVKGEFNDPALEEYMTLRNDALLSLAGVFRGNGATDQAHRAEMEIANPTMNQAALDAWARGQMKALEPRLRQNREITRSGPAAPVASAPVVPTAPTSSVPPSAVTYLKANPALRGAFDAKYGAGTSAQILGQ